jgi:hypothetical protein
MLERRTVPTIVRDYYEKKTALSAVARLSRSEEAYPGRSYRIDKQRPIQKEVSGLAAGLGNNETAMAGGTVKAPILGCRRWIVISADGITGT